MMASPVIARGLGTAVSCLGSVVLAHACSQTPAPDEPKACDFERVTLTVLASADINRAPGGEPRPVLVRIYQLANSIGLDNAAFEDVWKKDAETLGADLVKKEEFPVYPNTRTELSFERDSNANHVAAVALFRVPRGRSWYVVFDLPPGPGKGSCEAVACSGDGCDGGTPKGDPTLYIWLDESRVEDGIEHADFQPQGRSESRPSNQQAPQPPPEKSEATP